MGTLAGLATLPACPLTLPLPHPPATLSKRDFKMETAEGHKIKPKYTLVSSTEGFVSGVGEIALYSGKKN